MKSNTEDRRSKQQQQIKIKFGAMKNRDGNKQERRRRKNELKFKKSY